MRYPLLVDVNTSTTQRRLVMGFTILGTGSALPERSVSNDELSEFLDTSDEWIFYPHRYQEPPRLHHRVT